MRPDVRIEANDDRIFFDNSKKLPVSIVRTGAEADRGYDSICFFGEGLPKDIRKGRQYFVIDSQPEFIRISDRVGGPAIRFSEKAKQDTNIITNLFQAHLLCMLLKVADLVKERSILSVARMWLCKDVD